MYFPNELWIIIKNYQLGKEYWKRRMDSVLNSLPAFWVFNYRIHTSAQEPIRFTKEIYIPPFLSFHSPEQITIVYSMFEGYSLDGNEQPNSHVYENCILDEDGPNQTLEILPEVTPPHNLQNLSP